MNCSRSTFVQAAWSLALLLAPSLRAADAALLEVKGHLVLAAPKQAQ